MTISKLREALKNQVIEKDPRPKSTKKEKREVVLSKREKRTNRILNNIAHDLFQKPYTQLSPKQMDQVVGKMLYSANLKGRSFRQVRK